MVTGILGAVHLQEVFAIIVLVISVLSWVVNLIQGNSPNGAGPRQQRPKPRPQTPRNELEDLIQELTNDRRKQEKRAEASPAAKTRSERPRPAPTTVPQRPGSPPPYSPSRQPQQPPEPKRPVTNRVAPGLGEGIRSHHVGSRIESQPQSAPMVAPATNINNRTAAPTANQEKAIHPLVKLLRDPNGTRQALLLNEILQRPKSLRRD